MIIFSNPVVAKVVSCIKQVSEQCKYMVPGTHVLGKGLQAEAVVHGLIRAAHLTFSSVP